MIDICRLEDPTAEIDALKVPAMRREPERFSIAEAAVLAGMPMRALRRLAEDGYAPGSAKLGPTWTFEARALRQWIRLHKREGRLFAPYMIEGTAVYFIRAGHDGPIKIGFATDMLKRLFGLQTSHARRLRVLATVPAGREVERHLHGRFASLRLQGEWFAARKQLLDYIASLPGAEA